MSVYDGDDVLRQWLDEERERVLAACRAAGLMTYLVESEFAGTCSERLVQLRSAVGELREALGLGALPPVEAGDAR